MSNAEVYIGLGGNLGDPAKTFDAAASKLASGNFEVLKRSSLYRTKPYGYAEQPDFLNAVIEVCTPLGPREVLEALQQVEQTLGKKVVCLNGPRLIDLDLLYHGDTQIANEVISLPHPEIARRDFVLLPLAEIAPNFIDPASGRTIQEMVDALEKRHFTGEILPWPAIGQ